MLESACRVPREQLLAKKLLEELTDLNAELAAHLTGPGVKFISTGDLLTGVNDSSMATLMDSLYEMWNLDPVHGERLAYTKIGLALLKHINKKRHCTFQQITQHVIKRMLYGTICISIVGFRKYCL